MVDLRLVIVDRRVEGLQFESVGAEHGVGVMMHDVGDSLFDQKECGLTVAADSP